MTASALARRLGLPDRTTRRYRAEGMPTDSATKAKAWLFRHRPGPASWRGVIQHPEEVRCAKLMAAELARREVMWAEIAEAAERRRAWEQGRSDHF